MSNVYSPRRGILAAWIGALAVTTLSAADIEMVNSHRPYAPLDIRKENQASSSLSRSDRRELVQEFRGLLAMGGRNYVFEKWSGRSMADCYPPERSRDRWRHKCEIMMGQGNGYYFFYPVGGGQNVLQQVDVFLPTSDASLIEDLKPTIRQLMGRHERLLKTKPGYQAVGPIRHWNTGQQHADLFLDTSRTPNGMVRFIWSRGDLARTRQARSY